MIAAKPWPRDTEGDVYGGAKVIKTRDAVRPCGRYRGSPAHFDWVCLTCGYKLAPARASFNPAPRIDAHDLLGHTPCEQCGVQLRNCKDGSPRRHNWRYCSGKDESFRVVTVYDRERRLSVYARDAAGVTA